jgi:hypothetical protein
VREGVKMGAEDSALAKGIESGLSGELALSKLDEPFGLFDSKLVIEFSLNAGDCLTA